MNAPTESDYVVPAEIAGHPAWFRLEGQRIYYSKSAATYQTHYKRIKISLIGLAAAIPVLAFLTDDASRILVALAGVAIALLEGWLLLNQYGPLWVKYRTTSENLKRERWLLLSGAGDYKGQPLEARMGLLAERVEALLAEEQQAWTEAQKKALEELSKSNEWVRRQLDETKAGATPVTGGTVPPAGGATEMPSDVPGDVPKDAPGGVAGEAPEVAPTDPPDAAAAEPPLGTPPEPPPAEGEPPQPASGDQRPPATSTTAPVQ